MLSEKTRIYIVFLFSISLSCSLALVFFVFLFSQLWPQAHEMSAGGTTVPCYGSYVFITATTRQHLNNMRVTQVSWFRTRRHDRLKPNPIWSPQQSASFYRPYQTWFAELLRSAACHVLHKKILEVNYDRMYKLSSWKHARHYRINGIVLHAWMNRWT